MAGFEVAVMFLCSG